MKQKIFALCLAVICLSIGAKGTLSYFTAESTTHNVVTTGNVKIELLEEFPEGGVKGALPGDAVSKVVWVENTGAAPAYIRVAVKLTIVSAEGKPLPAVLPDGTSLVSFDLLPGWQKGDDGFYYYLQSLPAGERTVNLMERVTLAPQMNDLYQSSEIHIDITAYGVQSDNNGSTVWDSAGWAEA